MDNSFEIKFLKNHQIDKRKWDECIEVSPNALIYAHTFYLDNVAAGWNALAGRNYEWVMPLTYKTKYGFSYLYQPPFTQQLGVFAKPGVAVRYTNIFTELQRLYKFCEINLHHAGLNLFQTKNIQLEKATNFILDLSKGYDNIAAHYHNDLIKNLKKSNRFKSFYRQTIDFEKCISLYRKSYGERMPQVKEADYKNFETMCRHANKHGMLICREAVDEDGRLLAVVLLLSDAKRLYNIMNTTTGAGRNNSSNHFLLDCIIKEFAGKKLIFDFEGSDLAGVKAFYENFGAVDEGYFKCRYNNLNWPLRLFKR